MGWLVGWDQRVKITIDSGDITAALSNFPVLVYLSTASGINDDDVSFIFDEVGANSLKIAVTEDDGTTECYVEVEQWDNGNEKAWLWVKVPSIASGADTDIYLYYDNDHADNGAHVGVTNSAVAENVWDASFEMVSHMRDGADTSHIRDSTDHDNDGTKVAANNPIVSTSGKIGECQSFDGSDTIGIPDIAALGSLQTIEMWVKCVFSTDMNMYIWEEGSNVYQLQLYDADDHTGKPKVPFHSFLNVDTSDLPTSNIWYHITATVDGTAIAVYVDGVLDWSDAASRPILAPGNIVMGNYGGGGAYYFTGLMDEVRVSSAVRSTAWIAATYESGRDDLLDFGAEEPMDTYTETWGIDAAFQALGIERARGYDAAFQLQGIEDTADVDALFVLRLELARQLDAAFQRLGIERTGDVDAAFMLRIEIARQIDAAFQATIEKTPDFDAIFKGLGIERTADLDTLFVFRPELQRLFDAAFLQTNIPKSFGLDTRFVIRHFISVHLPPDEVAVRLYV